MTSENTFRFTISYDNPEYEQSLRQLNKTQLQDLSNKIVSLKQDPFIISKQLHHPYQGKHRVKINGNQFRLIITINLHSHVVKLWYVHSRSNVY